MLAQRLRCGVEKTCTVAAVTGGAGLALKLLPAQGPWAGAAFGGHDASESRVVNTRYHQWRVDKVPQIDGCSDHGRVPWCTVWSQWSLSQRPARLQPCIIKASSTGTADAAPGDGMCRGVVSDG
jgi:hypothetical protein